MTDTPAEEKPTESTPIVREKGKFVKGVSGNPKGRAKGSRNNITLRRLETEEALRNMLAPNARKVLQRAVDIALKGDPESPATTAMIKLILDKTLSTLRNEDVGESKDNKVEVTINQLVGTPGADNTKVIEARIVPSIPKTKTQGDKQ